MNKLFVILISGIIISGIVSISIITDQATAGSDQKFHFTQTFSSSQDLGQGYEEYQTVLVLAPNAATIYDGSITFTSTHPVTPIVFHEIAKDDISDQPIWTVDDKSFFVLSELTAPKTMGNLEFTGTALALRAESEFTVTLSTDGWIQGQPVDLVIPKPDTELDTLQMSRTNIPVTIPMHKGLYNGNSSFFIITDSSDAQYAKTISDIQEWQVTHAPPLEYTPNATLQKLYVFKDGIRGSGLFGYQPNILSAVPSESNYSALVSIVEISWKTGQRPLKFENVSDIMTAFDGNRINLNDTGIVVNAPIISWPDGQMTIRSDDQITDETTHDGGQIIDIDHNAMAVTFIAHRGWGPDGRTIYYIITDATPKGPAETMGVVSSPILTNLITNSTADLFQFKNGIIGSGPLGFQPNIAAAAPNDKNYTPIWRIYLVEWNDPKTAKVLETIPDIDHFRSEDTISVSIARPTNLEYVINSPFIDPFQ